MRHKISSACLYLLLILMALAPTSLPADVAGLEFTSQTIIRAFERNVSLSDQKLLLPVYEFLGFDYGDSYEGGLSAHFYGWGRWDMANTAYFPENPDGDLVYGYLEYSKPYSPLTVRVGRRLIFAGVINDSIDGIELISDLGPLLTTDLFGGLTAATDENTTDTTFGGRLAFHPRSQYELALSYQQTDADQGLQQIAGFNLTANWNSRLSFNGISGYNLQTGNWREHSYMAILNVGQVSITPSYQFFSYKDYFETTGKKNAIYSFLGNSDEQVSILKGDLQWQIIDSFDLGLKANYYTYAQRGESAAYYAASATIDFSNANQIGFEFGTMNGDIAENRYTLYRAYLYWADLLVFAPNAFVSIDGLALFYDAPVYDKDGATEIWLSIGNRFFNNTVEMKLSGVYAQDPYFDSDIGAALTVMYRFHKGAE